MDRVSETQLQVGENLRFFEISALRVINHIILDTIDFLFEEVIGANNNEIYYTDIQRWYYTCIVITC